MEKEINLTQLQKENEALRKNIIEMQTRFSEIHEIVNAPAPSTPIKFQDLSIRECISITWKKIINKVFYPRNKNA